MQNSYLVAKIRIIISVSYNQILRTYYVPATALRALGFALTIVLTPGLFVTEKALSKLPQQVSSSQNSALRAQEIDPVVLRLDYTPKVTGVL